MENRYLTRAKLLFQVREALVRGILHQDDVLEILHDADPPHSDDIVYAYRWARHSAMPIEVSIDPKPILRKEEDDFGSQQTWVSAWIRVS